MRALALDAEVRIKSIARELCFARRLRISLFSHILI